MLSPKFLNYPARVVLRGMMASQQSKSVAETKDPAAGVRHPA